MSYVQRVLQPGEIVRHTASVHWIIYWPGALCHARGNCGPRCWARYLPATPGYTWLIGSPRLLALIALYLLIREWFKWWTTEIAVTNRRVIYKTGFIQRTTNEMNMDKVESVEVEQSILGRILDYGTVIITGTGAGFEALPRVAQSARAAQQHHRRLAQSRCPKPQAASSRQAERDPRLARKGGARSRAESARRHRTTSRVSPRRSSPRSARSPASPISRIS